MVESLAHHVNTERESTSRIMSVNPLSHLKANPTYSCFNVRYKAYPPILTEKPTNSLNGHGLGLHLLPGQRYLRQYCYISV